MKGVNKLTWQTFFRVCTQEMDDLSQRAIRLVIEYCLEVLEEVEKTIRGKASLARLEAALDVQYAEKYENKVFQYYWALRHPVVKDAITKALANRFPARPGSRLLQDRSVFRESAASARFNSMIERH